MRQSVPELRANLNEAFVCAIMSVDSGCHRVGLSVSCAVCVCVGMCVVNAVGVGVGSRSLLILNISF